MARGDEIPRPRPWLVRVRDRKTDLGWQNMLAQYLDNLDRAWVAITSDPRGVSDRQQRLRGHLAWSEIEGIALEQWQYEVTGAARVWYAIDDDRRTLWITRASVGHPKETDARGGRR